VGERSSPEDEDLVSMGGGDDWPSGAARKEGHGDGGSRGRERRGGHLGLGLC